MKHVNKTVMGALMGALLMAFGSNSFGALLISEEFDGPEYAFTFENYEAGVASVAFSQDTSGVLSGANSAKVAVTSPGSDWWAIQVRSGLLNLVAGNPLTISFDIKSSAAINFDVTVEGPNPTETFPVSLTAGETNHFSFTTTTFANGGDSRVIFGLGNIPSSTDVWLDNIQIEGETPPQKNLPVEEEFDAPPSGENFGLFAFKNYGGGASYSFAQDTSNVLSGTNSAKLDIINSGAAGNWWAIQLRMENLIFEPNTIVAVSFDMKSTADINFIARFEGPGGSGIEPQDYPVSLLAGETKRIEYQSGMITNATAPGTFMLALGNSTTGAATVWVDRVKLRKWAAISAIGPIVVDPLPGTNGLILTWSTDVGYDYALETKSNLPIGNWTTNQLVPGVGGNVSVTTAVNQAQSFYRVTAE